MPSQEQTAETPSRLGGILLGKNPRRTCVNVGILLFIGGLAYLFFSFILLPVKVTGISMSPTFRNGDINFINCLAYSRADPRRGDIVGIRYSGRHTMFLKRIVGMPGESVAFEKGRILVNGQVLPEPYLATPDCNWEAPPHQLGYNEYYVVGDNRVMPFEDHEKGATQRKRILGRAVWGGNTPR